MIIEKSIKLNPAWPKYRFLCGQLTRILTDQDAPERLIGSQWHPDQG